MRMSPQYRAIRACARKKNTSCGWCRRRFTDGEWMALAIPEGGQRRGNMVLCQECASQIEE